MPTQTVEEMFGCKNAADLGTPWTHWFFYGPTGSGKTQLASTFPRPLFIVPQNEKSITTLRGFSFPYFEVCDMNNTRLNPKTGVGGMMSVIDKIETLYRQSPDTFPFDTIVIESLTHYSDLIQEQLTNGATKIMTQSDWGSLSSHLRTIQTRLRALDLHAVFTALDKTETSDDGKVVIGGPHLSGQLATKFPSACDVIGHCEVLRGKDNDIYRVHFRQHKYFPARSRYRQIPSYIDNFNFADIEYALEPEVQPEAVAE
jgi:hypothetical protein